MKPILKKPKFSKYKKPYKYKKQCDDCHKWFDEDELDLYKGKWLCNECEEEREERD